MRAPETVCLLGSAGPTGAHITPSESLAGSGRGSREGRKRGREGCDGKRQGSILALLVSHFQPWQ